MYKYKYGQRIGFDNGVMNGSGVIVGVALTEQLIIGVTYIVKVTDGCIPNKTYPYDTITVTECHIVN